ncbi:tRNA (N6-isopentenyl adenosine(37)-C2)-methylthiotransferase MiaB [Planctomycetota bacterium]
MSGEMAEYGGQKAALAPSAAAQARSRALKVYMATFGCQMNKLDSEIITGLLLERGYQFVADEMAADVVIFNTCSVRQKAENRLYSRLARLESFKKQHPDIIVGVTGCVAQQEKEHLFEQFKVLNFVIGTNELGRTGEILDLVTHGDDSQILAAGLDKHCDYDRNPAARKSTSHAFISAMRGCDKYCSYCVVPYARGREVSRPIDDIINEARRLIDDGVIEITVLGQRIDAYGKDLFGKPCLGTLLEKLAALNGLHRIKFITAHPKNMTRDVFEIMASSKKFSKYIHMPAQSGSNKVLRAMNRGYTRENYLEVVAVLSETLPEFNLTSDWIVGFPNETDADFEESVSLMQAARFGGSFIFKYSLRAGTNYAKHGDPVPDKVKKERNQILLRTQEEVSRSLQQQAHGQIHRVLVEGPSKTDKSMSTGRDDLNRIVVFKGGDKLKGRFVNVKITHSTPLTLFGELND